MRYVTYSPEGRCEGIVDYPDEGEQIVVLDKMPNTARATPDIDLEALRDLIAVNGQLRAREPFPRKFDKLKIRGNATDAATITGLPVGTTIKELTGLPLGVHSVDDGILQITSSETQQIRIQIDPFPYRTFEVLIDAS